MPQMAAKTCCVCGDMTAAEWVKDAAGRHYCHSCWRTRNQTLSPSHAPEQEPDEVFACPNCGGAFFLAGMDESGVCKGCAVGDKMKPAAPFRSHIASADARVSQAKDRIDERIKQGFAAGKIANDTKCTVEKVPVARDIPWRIIITAIIIISVLGAGGTCWWIVRSSNTEMEQRRQLATLKEQADIDLAEGRYEDASAKYGQAIATATRLDIEDDLLGNVAEAKKGRGIAQAKAAKEQQKRKAAAYKAFGLVSSDFYVAIATFVRATTEFRGIKAVDLKTARDAMRARGEVHTTYLKAATDAGKIDFDSALAAIPAEFSELRQLGQEIQKAAFVFTSNMEPIHKAYSAALDVTRASISGHVVDPKTSEAAEDWGPLMESVENAAINVHTAYSKILEVVTTDSEPQQPQARLESPQPASETQRAEVGKLLLEYARNQRESDEARAEGVRHLAAAKAARESGRTDEAKASLAQAQTANEKAKSTAEAMGRLAPQIEPYGEPLFEAVRKSLVSDNAVDARDRDVLAKIRLFNSPAFEASKLGNYASPSDCTDGQVAYERGMALLMGRNIEKNPIAAITWFRRASELGNAAAATQVGDAVWSGVEGLQDEQEAVKWFRKGAEGGDADGMAWLGMCYHKGKGTPKDLREAVRWYRPATDRGNLQAMHNLAVMYLQGEGVPQSEDEGCKLLRRAAEGGNTMSMEVLGQVAAKKQQGAVSRKPEDSERAQAAWNRARGYARGEGVPQDAGRAIQAYQDAASLGHAQAMWFLGLKNAMGDVEGIPQNTERAVYWYRAAIAAGNSRAMVNLGSMLEEGRGVPKNQGEAARLYQMAATQGDPTGMFNLGLAYEYGRGIAEDHAKAFYWYRESALHGYTDAMRNLHDLYAFGKGVSKSVEEGEKWMRRAAEMGNQDAAKFMKEIDYARQLPKEIYPVAEVFIRYIDAQREFDLFSNNHRRLQSEGDRLIGIGQADAAETAYQQALYANEQAGARLQQMQTLLPQVQQAAPATLEKVRLFFLNDPDGLPELRPYLEKFQVAQP